MMNDSSHLSRELPGLARFSILLVVALLAVPPAGGQGVDTPESRLRPLGSPSMVDRYRKPDSNRNSAGNLLGSSPHHLPRVLLCS